jgi:biotin transport system substrate-specific component
MGGRRSSVRDLALVATFAALIAALGFVPAWYPFGVAVPVTVQTLGVMLAGLALGSRRATLAVLTFLVLVAAGLHLLSGFRGGLGVFAGSSVGFLLGWLPGAWVTGALAESRPARLARRALVAWFAVAAAVGGIGVVYLLGVPLMAWRLHLSLGHALTVSAVYLPGDLVKVAVAAAAAAGLHRGYPSLLPRRTDTSSEIAVG